MIVIASKDNESPQVTLPGFSIYVRVPVCYTAVSSCNASPTGEERCVTTLKTAVQQTIPVPAVRVKGGMSLRNGMWHGLRNDIIMRNVKYGNWRKEIN